MIPVNVARHGRFRWMASWPLHRRGDDGFWEQVGTACVAARTRRGAWKRGVAGYQEDVAAGMAV